MFFTLVSNWKRFKTWDTLLTLEGTFTKLGWNL